MFERETINLYDKLKLYAERNSGSWEHSPVEDWKIDYFSLNLNEDNLVNFRRTPLANGMINFPDRPLGCKPEYLLKSWISGIPFWQKIKGARDIILELYKLRSRFRFKMSDVCDSLVGNPCYYKIGKIYLTDFAIRMCFYSKYIEREFLNPGRINILEVGGGFGGLCLKLLSSKNLDVGFYILVELPEILPLSYWYLRNSRCNKVLTVISEEDLDKLKEKNLNDKIAILAAPWMLKKIDINLDIFVNTMSFQHMTRENIGYYLSEVDRLNVRNLYLVNRDLTRDPTDVKISDYPIPQKYKLIKQDKYPFSNHIIKIYSL